VARKFHFTILRIEVTHASRGLSAIAELLVWLSMAITLLVWYLVARYLILQVGFRRQALQWRHGWFRGSMGRCHDNQYWDWNCCNWLCV